MTNISTGAGSKFAVGTTAAIDESSSAAAITDFQNDTFRNVAEVETIPEFGDTINPVTFTALADQRVRKFKGSRDAGSVDITAAFKATDQGQKDMRDALDATTQDDHNFRVTLNDGTSGGSSTVMYFRGKVMSRRVGAPGVDEMVRVTFSVALNTAIYQVDGS